MTNIVPFPMRHIRLVQLAERLARLSGRMSARIAAVMLPQDGTGEEARWRSIDRLGAYVQSLTRTAEFCDRCRAASELGDLDQMIARRDQLARELRQDQCDPSRRSD
jgi:hypothetical protein